MQTADPTSPRISDRECLESWARRHDVEGLRALVERYLAFVYSSAFRRTGDTARAAEITRAVFLVLARRARRLGKKTVLAGWLFHVTAIACRKLNGVSLLRQLWQRTSRHPRPPSPPDATLWEQLAPQIDCVLERLPTRYRNAVLLCAFLSQDSASAAKILRTSESGVEERVGRGMKKLANRLSERRAPVETAALASTCASEVYGAPIPESLLSDILQAMEASGGRRPIHKLACQTLRSLAWRRWWRRYLLGTSVFSLLLVIVGIAIWYGPPVGRTWLFSESQIWGARYWNLAMAESPRQWPASAITRPLDARLIQNAGDLYRTTNIWPVHLSFTREQWKGLEPKRISLLPNVLTPDKRVILRNPEARRSGLLGVLGYEYDWSRAQFEFGQVSFTDVATRVKGNIVSLWQKRPFKLDLNKFERGQKLAGLGKLTFDSLGFDNSCMSEALGYEVFRDAGVPAPRTAYAWLSVSVAKQWENRPFGLYLMEEVVDDDFAAERFGSRKTPIFKPSTYKLFEHMGEDWTAYAPGYDLKTKATPEQLRRVIDFSRLVTSATDAEFAARVGDFLDLDEFARFLAVEVLLPNYDSILTTGQNYFLYLHPGSNKFGFIPWDLDASWGNFWIGTPSQEQRGSIWRPWVGENRFLERVMAVDEFRRIYRAHLEDFVTRLYTPERLSQRIDVIAAAIRDPIAVESPYRLDKFEQVVGLKPIAPPRGWQLGVNYPLPFRDFIPARDLKQFIAGRARSVRSQLAGESEGIVFKWPKIW